MLIVLIATMRSSMGSTASIDDAHRAAAELGDDLVAAEFAHFHGRGTFSFWNQCRIGILSPGLTSTVWT